MCYINLANYAQNFVNVMPCNLSEMTCNFAITFANPIPIPVSLLQLFLVFTSNNRLEIELSCNRNLKVDFNVILQSSLDS